MIYTHSKDGRIQRYGEMSGIGYFVIYRCSYEVVGCNKVNVSDRNVFLAATDIEDANRLIEMYEEEHEFFRNAKFNPVYKEMCIRGNDGNLYTYWYRGVVRIDWTKDYHFYEDPTQEEFV